MFILRDYQNKAVCEVAQSWRQGFKRPCVVMPCGAGKSIVLAEIAKRTTDRGKRVLFLVHRQELCEQIENTFQEYGVDMNLVTVGMVQTITRRLKKITKPDLIITDENHHCLAASYMRIYDLFPDVKCVGVTATPIRLNGSGLGEINDHLIIGPTVKKLISMDCLAPFDYYAPSVADFSRIHTRAGEFVATEVEQLMNMPHIYGDVIRYYRQISDGKQAICYCASIKCSQDMTLQFQKEGIAAVHIDGSTPQTERSEIIRRFRSGEIRILCNVDLISEGFDVPDCNTAILLRPTKSLTLYIQQAMRCMRYKPGKRATVIDHVGNVHRFGLLDMDRQWTLEPKPEKNKMEKEVKLKQCPRCYYTHEPDSECPNCGYEYESERKVPHVIKDAKLEKITEQVAGFTRPGQCRSVAELAEYAKKKGYKPGWVYYQARDRGIRC
jgi:superfamily II DNA or RNA helicase